MSIINKFIKMPLTGLYWFFCRIFTFIQSLIFINQNVKTAYISILLILIDKDDSRLADNDDYMLMCCDKRFSERVQIPEIISYFINNLLTY